MRAVVLVMLGLLVWSGVPAAEQVDLSQEEIALGYYRPVAEQGESLAQLTLGEMYLVGEEVRKDLVESYAWLSAAAHQGVGEAVALLDQVKQAMTPEQLAAAEAKAKEYIANFTLPQ